MEKRGGASKEKQWGQSSFAPFFQRQRAPTHKMAEREYSSSPPPGQHSTTDARTNRDSIKKGFSDMVRFADLNFSRAKQVCG